MLATVPSLGQHFASAKVYHEMGRIHVSLGHYEEAVQAFQAATKCAELMKDGRTRQSSIAVELQSLARTHLKFGNQEAAETIALQCLEMLLLESQQSLETAKCHTLLATIYEAQHNKNVEAMQQCEAALVIYLYNEGETPRSLTLARLYEKMAGLDSNEESIGYVQRALEVCRRAGLSDGNRIVMSLLERMESGNAVSSGRTLHVRKARVIVIEPNPRKRARPTTLTMRSAIFSWARRLETTGRCKHCDSG